MQRLESVSDSEEEAEVVKEIKPKTDVPEIPVPQYSDEELEQLVTFIRRMTILFAMNHNDWTENTLDIIRNWLLKIDELMLCIFYDGNKLTACLTFPLAPINDLMYFLREPLHILTLDGFHDEVTFGTIHEDVDGTLLQIIHKVYAPIFYHYVDWSENIKSRLCTALNKFLQSLTALHYKMAGMTTLFIPNLLDISDIEKCHKDREIVRSLETIAVQWANQIRLCIADKEPLIPLDLICAFDEFEFWLYRFEVVQGLHVQLYHPDVLNIIEILKNAQSVYIKQITELTAECEHEMDEAKSNIQYLQLLIKPCKDLDLSESPAKIPEQLPKIIHLFRYIWLNSKFYNTSEYLTGLFRDLSNQVIMFCREQVNIDKILDGNPRFGIKMCDMAIDCCLSYRAIYDRMSRDHEIRNPEIGWALNTAMIFNHVDAFVERLHDLIDLCESMIVFGRMDETEKIIKPKFGGTRGQEFERTCTEIEKLFFEGLTQIRLQSKDIILNVHSNQWYDDVVKYRTLVNRLEEIIERLMSNVFLCVCNVEEALEVLANLNYHTYRKNLRLAYIRRTSELWLMFIMEMEDTDRKLIDRAKVREAWMPQFASRALSVRIGLQRITWLYDRLNKAQWLPQVSQSQSAAIEYERLKGDFEKNLNKIFEDWVASVGLTFMQRLENTLLSRSKIYEGLLDCNIDRSILKICEEARIFQQMGFTIPVHMMPLYSKYESLQFVYNSVITVCLDYNRILSALKPVERKLFKPLIDNCNRKIVPGILKLNWGGEMSDAYIADCVKHTLQLQEFIDIYKRANIHICRQCEKICDNAILKFTTKSVVHLGELTHRLNIYREKVVHKIAEHYKTVIELIVAVYKGFESNIQNMTNEWLRYIQTFEDMLEEAFITSAKNSLKNIYDALHGDDTIGPSPLFTMELDLIDKRIIMTPEMTTIINFTSNCLNSIVKSFDIFPRLWKKFQLPVEEELLSFSKIISNHPDCLELQIRIDNELTQVKKELNLYLFDWVQFKAVWELDKDVFMFEYEQNEYNTVAATFDANIERYTELGNQVSLQETISNVDFITVNTNKLKNGILEHIEEWQSRYIELLKKVAFDKITDVYAYIEKNLKIASFIPRTLVEMKKQITEMERLLDEIPKFQLTFPPILGLFRVLDKYEIVIPKHIREMVSKLELEWTNYIKKVIDCEESLGNTKEEFKATLLEQAAKLHDIITDFYNDIMVKLPTTSKTTSKVAVRYLEAYRQRVNELFEFEASLVTDLSFFHVNQPDDTNLRSLDKYLKIFENIWELVKFWDDSWDSWKVQLFWNIDIDELDDIASNLFKKFNRLCKQYKDKNWEILETKRRTVDEFRKTLPLITALKNTAMRERHWNRVKAITNKDFDQNSVDFKLGAIIAMNFQAFSEDISDISNAATMELQIENGIKNIAEIWKTMSFEMVYHRDNIYRIKNVDDCVQMLEDHQVQISSMKSTRFVAPFAKEVDYWEKTLSYIAESIEIGLVVQRQWLYLENIFSGDDIKKQLPIENERFLKITDEWRYITTKMSSAGTAVKATHFRPPNFLLNRLNLLDSRLEKIQRALELYLETKRQLFPRFYFISNDDLLEILGNARRPDLVQSQLKKLFDNVYKLELKKIVGKKIRFQGIGMYADDGEFVEFLEPMWCEGASEVWLNMVEVKMLACLKVKLKQTRNSLKKMLATRDKWLKMWPGQLCLTTAQMQWTTDCTRSLIHCKLIDGKKPLKKLKKKQLKVLAKLSEMSRKDLPKLLRIKVVAMITIEIHGRDVIERMYKVNCKDVGHFEWFSQLRFYWDREIEDCVIRQTNTHHMYGYEYTGNSGRLVITPLTDRCFITLTTALHLYRGGSPKGPAGTGKTETVKDLGKALGMWVIVTNCSEGLDYKSIGKNYSGLAQSGAWGCFDEFNRINIEVLSVVAQQILSIYTALAAGLKRFFFEGMDIALKPTIGLFITMNPGYAGRTELPDNLKSMFRPISMIVPDNAIIAENLLFSDGFQNARNLARKVFTLYELSKQQLSKQFHYDFGLRSMVALLRYAGLKRRLLTGINEEEVVYLAMKDMNIARLTVNDLPLFNGIMSDIFPGTSIPSVDYSDFQDTIEKDFLENGLQPLRPSIKKVIELFETKNSRHSSMLIGETGTCKSVTWKTLQGTYNRMKAANKKGYETVVVYPMNPKSLNMAEIYGEYNLATGEWLDGVLSSIMRTICSDESPVLKWILFDGPVDAVWIENMNSVMDDNKILTLVNSERITMPAQVSLLFEAQDLAVASPATVSRCGIVYCDYIDFGWRPSVKSWLQRQKSKGFVKILEGLFDKWVEKVVEYKRTKCRETVVTNELNLVTSLCNLLECFATKENGIIGEENPEILDTMTRLWFYFSMVWSLCATVDEEGRIKMDAYVREIENVFPIKDTIYDYYVNPSQKIFLPWDEKLSDSWHYNTEAPFYKIIVPTVDTVRYEYIVSNLIAADNPVMLVGGVGTGKTSTAISVTDGADKEKYTILNINISAQTTAAGLQESIELKTEKRTKVVFVPIGGKKMICFMDDFNMPAKEVYGSQPPLELIRQWLDYKFWYNRSTQQRIYVKNVLLMVAMGPPGGGRQVISLRTQSRFSIINMTFPNDNTITRIFGTMLRQKLSDFSVEVRGMWKPMTAASIYLYNYVIIKMLPTPAKIHYLFNLRDISKIYQGLLRSSPESQQTSTALLRLWIHECFRVFADRLVNEADNSWFISQLNETLGKYFESTFHQLCPSKKSPIFGDFISGIYYDDLNNIDELRKYLETQMEDYNNAPGMTRMDLVFFKEAIEHITRIVRVISQPRGHMFNMGMGGSGRQVFTRMASYLADLVIFKIEVTKKYKTSEFREDLKVLYKQAGVKNKATCFIFTSEQVVDNSFLEIVNNILSTGEANLFKSEEFEDLKNELEPRAKREHVLLTTESLYIFFLQTIRTNLHVALCFSPIGEKFRAYIRQYPALINATTSNWFREWPQEALLEVAQKFLQTCKLYVETEGETERAPLQESMVDIEIKLKISVAFVFSVIHTTVGIKSETMFAELKRRNYVTPINYLELVSGFKEILDKKRKDISGAANKLRNGLLKIAETREKVGIMQAELQISQEQVTVLAVECEEAIVIIRFQSAEAEEAKTAVKAKSATIAVEEVECKALAAVAQADLEEVMPMIDAAVRALDALSKKDISEVKSYGRPPVKVEKVMECIMILLEKPPTWEMAKKVLGEQSFLNDLKTFDKDHVADKTLKKIVAYTRDPELEPDKVGTVSGACKSLMLWALAIENYAKVFRIVAPKQAKLDDALSSLRAKQAMLEEARNNLRALEAQLAALQADFDEKSKNLDALKAKARKLEIQLERAIILVDSLGGESQRWIDTVKLLDKQFLSLPGDCLISTAFVSYIGPFDTKYRIQLMDQWQNEIEKQKIPHTEDLKVTLFLSDPVTIREWNIQGLPSDEFSTENGVIVIMGRRWPLIIDPQTQAHAWIRNLEKDDLLIIDFEQYDYVVVLEKALQNGNAVLLQNVAETLDPAINPILSRSFTMQGGQLFIKFNDKFVPYNDKFRFYITTKLTNPTYPPEISSKTTLVNFAIKESGLQAQLLGLIVRKEKPILEEQKDNLVVTIARNKRTLIDLENEILRLLNESKGSLLENEELFNTLDKSKKTSVTVKESLSIAEVTEIEIDFAREGYQPAAERSAILFFVLMDMSNIDPMYQFSLSAYVLLFSQSMDRSLKNPNLPLRISNINEYHTYSVYKNTCRGLFEIHKLLFSTHMCVKILKAAERINMNEYDFLLKGGIVVDKQGQTANPWPDWISEQAWDNISTLDKIPGFHGLIESFEQNPKQWLEWYSTPTPETTTLPGDWHTTLTDFQKMCVVRCLRSDRMSFCLTSFIVNILGSKFVEPPGLDLKMAVDESIAQTPLIFVLSPGVDPTASLITLAEQVGMSSKLFSLSLGQGQAPVATKLLMKGAKDGNWIFLANCHLSLSWMPTLDKIIETMQKSKIHTRFRLWLSSSPNPDFPIAILQNGIKMTTEPPRGIRANMIRLYRKLSDGSFLKLQNPENLSKYKKLLFALCYFHTILLERKKFLELGWNIIYSFNDSDFEVSEILLTLYLNEYDETPWGALKYLIAGVNYGGHVTDDFDRRLLLTYINTYFHENALTVPNFKLSSLLQYVIPRDGDMKAYVDFIQLFPAVDRPEAFGQHPNADIASLIAESKYIFGILLSMQVQDTVTVGETTEDKVLRLAIDIEMKIPNKMDYEGTAKLIGLNRSPLQVVLLQEMERYNRLLGNIKLILKDVQKGIKGLVIMSTELEEVFNAINDGRVPAVWLKSYSSLKPLAAWARDLVFRIEHFANWAKTLTPPALFWLAAYTFPTGFLTAVLQTTARITFTPIDELSWDFHVFVEEESAVLRIPKDTGVYVKGLYLEGAGWNRKGQHLVEPLPMELVSPMPIIHFRPVESLKKKTRGIYQCPSYYFPKRSGAFIIAVDLKSGLENSEYWIKRGTALLLSLTT